MVYARIIGTGSYLPERIVTNSELAQREFLYNGEPKVVTLDKIFEITGMKERHYARPDEHVEDPPGDRPGHQRGGHGGAEAEGAEPGDAGRRASATPPPACAAACRVRSGSRA